MEPPILDELLGAGAADEGGWTKLHGPEGAQAGEANGLEGEGLGRGCNRGLGVHASGGLLMAADGAMGF
jgi:hypothetical protein